FLSMTPPPPRSTLFPYTDALPILLVGRAVRSLLGHAVRSARTNQQPPGRVRHAAFREPHLAPHADDRAGGFEPARPGRTEVVHAEVDRNVSARWTDDGSDREPHRDVNERREDAAMHQPLQVAVVRTC